jgi:predicted  nucleic acid-binding Zn-ribbon protein
MPSTVEFLGKKLLETKESLTGLMDKNAKLKTRISKLKRRVQTLQEALKGTVSQFKHKIKIGKI